MIRLVQHSHIKRSIEFTVFDSHVEIFIFVVSTLSCTKEFFLDLRSTLAKKKKNNLDKVNGKSNRNFSR